MSKALEAVRTFRPLTDSQVLSLLAKTAKAASQGEFEPFGHPWRLIYLGDPLYRVPAAAARSGVTSAGPRSSGYAPW